MINKSILKIKPLNLMILCLFTSTCFLSPNLLSAIFLGRLGRLFFYGFSVAILLLLLIKKKLHKAPNIDVLTKIFYGGMLIYITGIILASLVSSGVDINFIRILARFFYLFHFSIIILYADEKIIRKCMDVYSNFLLLLAILAVILFIQVNFTTNSYPFNEFIHSERPYNNYLIGLTLKHGGNAGLFKRAMSFYDEPGTFAMMLLPGIFWFAVGHRSYWKLCVLCVALFISFSFGGWLTLILVLPFLYQLSRSMNQIKKTLKKIILFSIASVTVFFVGLLSYLQSQGIDTFALYFLGKMYSEQSDRNTSGGVRVHELITILGDFLFTNPLGLGASSNLFQEVDFTISVQAFYNIIESGVLGLLGYLILFVSLGCMMWIIYKKNQPKNKTLLALSASVLSLMIMSLQRADMFSFPTGIFICAFFVRTYLEYIAHCNNQVLVIPYKIKYSKSLK